jgi:NAD(P)-dependent dehydrogenase (short-subunit alcohol dehydrogenase family)
VNFVVILTYRETHHCSSLLLEEVESIMTSSSLAHAFLGKVALVTGAGSGIGLATAQVLYTRGATIALCDINQKALEEAEQLLKHTTAQKGQQIVCKVVNVAVEAEVFDWIDGIVSKFGRLDLAANIAGIPHSPAPITRLSNSDYDAVFDVNVRGVFHCLRAELKHMGPGSSIVNTASGAALMATIDLSIYSSTKSAICGFTSAGAREWGKNQIRVNAVAPGIVMTAASRRADTSIYLKPTIDATPLGRAGEPEEIATAIAFLLSDEASYISGAILRVDGGYCALSH